MTVPASADRLRASLWAGVLVVLAAWPAGAHRFDPALLELREAASGRHEVRWRTTARTEGLTLALPPGCTADGSWPEYTLDCGADGLEGRSLRVDGFAGRPIDVLLRVHRLDGAQQVAILRPDAPTVVVSGRAPGVGRYVRLGIEHILLGLDHLLFVFSLLLLVAGRRRLVWTVTAFTAGHSVTLAAATLGWARLPTAAVEALIAASIVLLARELLRPSDGTSFARDRPWWVAAGFGLLHGLGFASALSEAGLPEGSVAAALLLFNLGVEIGQLLFIAGVLALGAALAGVVRRVPISVAAYAIGALAAAWTMERLASLTLWAGGGLTG